ncbi:MAG: SAGA HAT/Core module component [Caeruleum heppii]|nr:MAG: SAGA HAT/Core module component [Caeruleum heppii]
MANRSRPRGPPTKEDDTHEEERNMWKEIVGDMKKLKGLNVRAAEVSKLIVEAEDSIVANTTYTVRDIDALQGLYREGLKLAEEEQKILKEDPNGAIQNISILTALRTASEIDLPRSTTALKPRNPKRAKLDSDSVIETPAASPSVTSVSSHPRLKGSSGRSGSVSSVVKEGKEPAGKVDDGGLNTGAESVKGTSAEKAGVLVKNADVAYKQSKIKGVEGEWIQCIIISVIGDGKNKRYEVQDPEPDETGAPGQVYKTTAAALIPIPAAGAPLTEFPKGKQVLAKYPETTTFYRAEVMGTRKDSYRLKFEGEDEIGKEQDVERRFVLDYGAK